jgi:hypothetical protein
MQAINALLFILECVVTSVCFSGVYLALTVKTRIQLVVCTALFQHIQHQILEEVKANTIKPIHFLALIGGDLIIYAIYKKYLKKTTDNIADTKAPPPPYKSML